jgi:serine/threonine protein kinase
MGGESSKVAVLQSLGKYDLLEKIAEGGMGAIYRGRDRDSGQVVAIKIMPPHMASNPTLLQRFEQEFRAASKLDHPNVVRAIDYNDKGSTPYLVMEFVEGESLGQKIDRTGRLPEADAIRIIAQVAQGLHRAHKQGLIHRDVKPDNILVQPDGTAKLADLGLVKEADSDLNLTKTGRGLGTPHFMAPEQFRNAKNADVRCDIYSLGATLYQMLTGELPFRSSGPLDAWMKKINNELVPPRKLVPSLTERTDWAILRAMSAQPECRPATCREFIEDLTGKSTRRVPAVDGSTQSSELWYVVSKDPETGEARTRKGTTSGIRNALRDGNLGEASQVLIGRSKTGPFEPLRAYPEFRDLVVIPAPLPPSGARGPVQPPAPSPSAATTPAVSTSSTEGPRVPHISLPGTAMPPESSATGELVKWLFLFALFAGSAAVAYWLFP